MFAALRTARGRPRKAPGQRPGRRSKDPAREKAREEARKRLEEEAKKPRSRSQALPEFGTRQDFQLVQAINQLKGQPVAVSKAVIERKAEVKTQ